MTEKKFRRAHLIAGGFPPGSSTGHDHDHARLRLLGLLAERDVPASVANDFVDIEKWLPVTRLLITYDRRLHGCAAAYGSRVVGKRRVHCIAAQCHCLGHGFTDAFALTGMRDRATICSPGTRQPPRSRRSVVQGLLNIDAQRHMESALWTDRANPAPRPTRQIREP